MKVIFVSPCFNAEKNLERLIHSVALQKNENWIHCIIDDLSDDNTAEYAVEITTQSDFGRRYLIAKNKEKKFALRNIVELARNYQDDEEAIIAVIDGDDQLCNPDTVDLLIEQYEAGADVVWTAHRWDTNGMNISRPMPNNVNPYQWQWSASHLRTFRASLLKDVSDDNFKDWNGEWFERGYDQALMLPLLYKTHKRKYISDVCYLYNIESVSVNDRDWAEKKQLSTVNFVRARGFVE